MRNGLISVENAGVSYGPAKARTHALRGVSLSFAPASLTVIMGPSGSGKTTLLSLLGCLLTPDTGSVYWKEKDIVPFSEEERGALRARHVGFIFQAFRLFRSLSALENVSIAGDISRVAKGSRQARELLEELGMGTKLSLKPDDLSGGEKQRVAIARALVKDPALLLADEPTASLDSTAGDQIAKILSGLAKQQGKTVIVVTHDLRWTPYADRVVTLRDGEVIKDE